MGGLLDGRVALVTGGSRGLGRAICRTLAREGAKVAFNYLRSTKEAEELVAQLRASGAQAFAYQVSVLDKKGLW
ncbi:MAG: SDR family NAD(P)-dependent oxidoreductase, partial [Deltaproteobacteria bacterium]|nr:SDR family NAD(P)-dependent oxidoreductase [Deltaproteobacteria bacterium]